MLLVPSVILEFIRIFVELNPPNVVLLNSAALGAFVRTASVLLTLKGY